MITKARAALERYGHQLVIANSLHRRKFEVALIDAAADSDSTENVEWIKLSSNETETGGKEIEEDIVRILESRHAAWIHAHEMQPRT